MSPISKESNPLFHDNEQKSSPDQEALGKLASLHITSEGGIDLANRKIRSQYLRMYPDIEFSKKALRSLSRIKAENTEEFFNKAHALLAVQNFIGKE